MKKIVTETTFLRYDSLDELPEASKNLMKHAIQARKTAYAPYSRFRVGAAVILDDGTIVIGTNQENAAYPSGLCAERVALYAAASAYPGKIISAIAISAASDKGDTHEPIPPCGSCRQSIIEYEQRDGRPISILFMGEDGAVILSQSTKNLLPLSFDKNFL
ncbi:cytidine deaminase [Flavobacterium sp. SE-s28]|uniref:Cytidine deaminase n=2 Tax=Flavobacterium silvaticum TaxID=1852020 RepID=A0A972FP72_9FLAO|nr:cytidine deaminase [Flavobacterium silvaticum]NMH29671.1 cytidine deaminase [Flavobacterium silvaticum]